MKKHKEMRLPYFKIIPMFVIVRLMILGITLLLMGVSFITFGSQHGVVFIFLGIFIFTIGIIILRRRKLNPRTNAN